MNIKELSDKIYDKLGTDGRIAFSYTSNKKFDEQYITVSWSLSEKEYYDSMYPEFLFDAFLNNEQLADIFIDSLYKRVNEKKNS